MKTILLSILLLAVVAHPVASAAYEIDRTEAIRTAFGCDYNAISRTLTQEQIAQISELGGRPGGKLVTRYRPACADPKSKRSGYIVTRTVRTLPQTLLVVVSEENTVEQVVVLSFLEPSEYKGSARWFKAFVGRKLNDDLNVQRAIPMMAGASITSRSTTQIVREVLALHTVIAR